MLLTKVVVALAASGEFFLHLAVVLVPLFVIGSFSIALLQEYLPPERIERLLHRYDGGMGNVVAAGIGGITTFCSCSTVPILAGLLQAGAPIGLAFSFLLASPLVNELAVMLLVGLFGVKIAGLYVVFTLASAVVMGTFLGTLGLEAHLKDVDLLAGGGQAVASDGGRSVSGAGDGSACGCGSPHDGRPGEKRRWSHTDRIRRAASETRTFSVDFFPYLVLGMAAGAFIHGFVPEGVMTQYFGAGNPLAVPLAAVAGAPIYVSMSAMLPIAAALSEQGIPIGTVLAFVVGGAGVSIPNLILLSKLFDRTLLAIYAATVVAIGVIIGVVFNSILL